MEKHYRIRVTIEEIQRDKFEPCACADTMAIVDIMPGRPKSEIRRVLSTWVQTRALEVAKVCSEQFILSEVAKWGRL